MDATITLHVDGQDRTVTVDTRTSLLDALRERLGNTSPKKGCDHGQCGACTILVAGRRTLSCLTLAVAAEGDEVVTAAGLAAAAEGDLHPVQQAFHEKHALQCGYCTPGFVMATVSLLKENPSPSEEEIRVGLEAQRLEVQVTADKPVYQVRQKAMATVRVTHAGKPLAGTEVAFAAVDEGLLALAPNGSWNLLETMFRELGALTAIEPAKIGAICADHGVRFI